MIIAIGNKRWTAVHAWIDIKTKRFCWLSTGGRKHSRPLNVEIRVQERSLL